MCDCLYGNVCASWKDLKAETLVAFSSWQAAYCFSLKRYLHLAKQEKKFETKLIRFLKLKAYVVVVVPLKFAFSCQTLNDVRI